MTGVNNLFVSSRSLGGLSPVQQTPVKVPLLASQRSPRFFYWLAFFVLSLIVAGASIEASDRVQESSRSIKNQKWAVSCAIISWGVALTVVIMHISPVLSIFFVNTKFEGGVCIVMMALWSALVAVISDSTNGLAVDGEGSVSFGNLYYCGWGGFVCAVMLFLNYLKQVYLLEISEELSLRSDRLNLWICCFIISIILTSSAANIFDHECLGSERYGTKFCNRSLLALVDGATGCGLSIIIIGMKLSIGFAPWGIELLLAVLLFLCNCFSMGLVTAEDGPGAKIGNLFYFSWLSLIVPFILMSSTFEYIRERREEGKEQVVDAYEQQQQQQPMMHAPPSDVNKNFVLSNNFYSSAQSVAPTEYSGDYARSQYDGSQSVVSGYDGRAGGKSVYEGNDRRQSFYSQGASTYAIEYQSEYGEGQSKAGGYSQAGGMDAGRSYASGMDADFKKPGMNTGRSYASGMDSSLKKIGDGRNYGGDMDRSYQNQGMEYSHGISMDASNQQSVKVKKQPWSGRSVADSYNSSFSSGMDAKKPPRGGIDNSSFV